jgi:hypothetical protein
MVMMINILPLFPTKIVEKIDKFAKIKPYYRLIVNIWIKEVRKNINEIILNDFFDLAFL